MGSFSWNLGGGPHLAYSLVGRVTLVMYKSCFPFISTSRHNCVMLRNYYWHITTQKYSIRKNFIYSLDNTWKNSLHFPPPNFFQCIRPKGHFMWGFSNCNYVGKLLGIMNSWETAFKNIIQENTLKIFFKATKASLKHYSHA